MNGLPKRSRWGEALGGSDAGTSSVVGVERSVRSASTAMSIPRVRAVGLALTGRSFPSSWTRDSASAVWQSLRPLPHRPAALGAAERVELLVPRDVPLRGVQDGFLGLGQPPHAALDAPADLFGGAQLFGSHG